MCDSSSQKLHVVCLPFPAQGHVNPIMHLAKLLHSNGLHITFVNSEFIHKRLSNSLGPDFVKGLPDFQFETIPDGLPPSMDDTQDIPALCDSTRKHCYTPLKELIGKLNSLSSSQEVPPVSCIIADANMSFAEKVANEFGIPEIRFWTASACGLLGYLQYDELVERGIFPFRDESFANGDTSDSTLDWVTGMKNIQLKYLPNFIRLKSKSDDFMFDFKGSVSKDCMKSSSIIINTFQELESEVLDVIMAKNPNVYNIGPLHLLNSHFIDQKKENEFMSSSSGLSFWKSDAKSIQWLEQWEPNSVIYVNYGSIAVMNEQNLKEFAWGLADSKQPFLWIVRPNLVMGENAKTPNLPKEFLDEIKGRGYITSWCPQEQVLAHPSIGLFLTHCGWNSTLESICYGVPMICWPLYGEQPTNCWFSCTRWGIGIEAKHEVKREEIADIVKEAMEGDKGKEMRRMSLEWKTKAMEVTDEGGSSYKDFKRLIKEKLFVTINE